MLLDDIDAPRLHDLHLPEDAAVKAGQTVLAQIARIEGALPQFLDVSSQVKWRQFIEAMLQDVEALVDQGKFRWVDSTTVHRLERKAFSKPVLAAIGGRAGYVHGDLSGANLFVLPDGYRVIDWQRTLLGPPAIDLAVLLESLGHPAERYVGAGVVAIVHLLRVQWFVQCALHWFPAGVED